MTNLEIHRMISIFVLLPWRWYVTSPECDDLLLSSGQQQWRQMLAESVDIGIDWDGRRDLEVLILEDQAVEY